jgi:thiamine biosynthesis lipoprotein
MKNTIIISLVLLLGLAACNAPQSPGRYYKIHGLTQGTEYLITYQHRDSVSIQPEVDALLQRFDMSLSTYIPNSLISRINNNEEGVVVDELFKKVWDEAYRINALTDGAFDITVWPLVNAWGFGPGRKLEMDQHVIDSLMQFIGMDRIRLENDMVVKDDPRIQLDVNAIAQGFAVEVVSGLLEEKGITNYMINIGGEIKCRGVNPDGRVWRIGVDKPVYGNLVPGQELEVVLQLDNLSLASSGNYRKYYEVDGKKIVHTIDPKTGYTRPSTLLSATIITQDCMTADALATACMVKGFEGAKELINSLDGVEAFLIYTDEDGLFLDWSTPGMEEMIAR